MTLSKLVPMAGLLAVLAVPPAQPTWSRSAVGAILTRYATGDYAGAIRAIEGVDQLPVGMALSPDAPRPDDAFGDWQRAAKDWIRLGAWPTGLRRRQLIAATVALEVVRARPELDPHRRILFLGWACELVRDHPVGNEAERLWYLTSIAVMGEVTPFALLPAKAGDLTLGPLRAARTDPPELVSGHLAHAMAAFPNEGRFRLAEALARAALTSVAQFSPSRNWMGANELPPKNPPTDRDQAKRLAVRLAALPAIESDLQALSNDDQVHIEAELNLAYLSARQQRWDEALAHLDRVGPTHDPFAVCLSHYLRGWVFQRTGRRDGAIAEYRLALEASPKARSISTMLADQLAQAGRQTEAYDVLNAGLKASLAAADSRPKFPTRGGRAGAMPLLDQPKDPWDQFQHGDIQLIPAYFSRLREALR